ncbi:hypothetical protein HPB50_016670 [Hyalomma asiaticum]|uniref:Uncharacterized protein n=1 Tax=Hyalomma asiaticum TaxID=266040 RepID=A0ACB7RMJ3_HYAAI|nr:hypothetical protein HPB50_016670 [Hyalomma asiaticum]
MSVSTAEVQRDDLNNLGAVNAATATCSAGIFPAGFSGDSPDSVAELMGAIERLSHRVVCLASSSCVLLLATLPLQSAWELRQSRGFQNDTHTWLDTINVLGSWHAMDEPAEMASGHKPLSRWCRDLAKMCRRVARALGKTDH